MSISRNETFEEIILGEQLEMPKVIDNVDKLFTAIINKDSALPVVPKTATEKYLARIIDSTVEIPSPLSRIDTLLYSICTKEKLTGFVPRSKNEELLYQILLTGALDPQIGGKNFANPNEFFAYGTGTIVVLENGINFSGNYYFAIPVNSRLIGETCVFHTDSDYLGNIKLYKDDTKTAINTISKDVAFTMPDESAYIFVYKSAPIGTKVNNMIFTNIQLEVGDHYSGYEPYKERT